MLRVDPDALARVPKASWPGPPVIWPKPGPAVEGPDQLLQPQRGLEAASATRVEGRREALEGSGKGE